MHLAVLIVATPEGSGAGFSLQVAASAEVNWGKDQFSIQAVLLVPRTFDQRSEVQRMQQLVLTSLHDMSGRTTKKRGQLIKCHFKHWRAQEHYLGAVLYLSAGAFVGSPYYRVHSKPLLRKSVCYML
jgi:hypothetical protein